MGLTRYIKSCCTVRDPTTIILDAEDVYRILCAPSAATSHGSRRARDRRGGDCGADTRGRRPRHRS